MAFAQPSGEPPPQAPTSNPSGDSFTLFPNGDIYAVYAADPHRPTNTSCRKLYDRRQHSRHEEPPHPGGYRRSLWHVAIRAGDARGRAWQISVEAGFDALFDSQNKLDVVGWDGNSG